MAARKKAVKKAAKKPRRKAPAKKKAGRETTRMSSASPSFTVNDIEKSLAWYRDVAGFAVEDRWEEGGKLTGVMVRAGDVSFMLGQDDWKKGRERKKGEGFRIYCETRQKVDDIARRIKAGGGKLDQEPQDMPWGTRAFSLTDPDGFNITIASVMKKR